MNTTPTNSAEFANFTIRLTFGTVALIRPASEAEWKRTEKIIEGLIVAALDEYVERTITSAVAAADAKLGGL